MCKPNLIAGVLVAALPASPLAAEDLSLWQVYDDSLRQVKYIELTHAFQPVQPVWPGFAAAEFSAAKAARTIPGLVEKGESRSSMRKYLSANQPTLFTVTLPLKSWVNCSVSQTSRVKSEGCAGSASHWLNSTICSRRASSAAETATAPKWSAFGSVGAQR